MGLVDRAYEGLGPALQHAAGVLLRPLVAGLMRRAEITDDLVSLRLGPFGAVPVFDLARSPVPRYLGQAAGLDVPAGLSLEETIARIRGRGVSKRGTPGALLAAARTTLAPGGLAELVERDGSAHRARLVTYTAQTPDPAATLAAAVTEKPVGIVLTHEVRLGRSYAQALTDGATYAQTAAAGRTYDQRRRTLPDA